MKRSGSAEEVGPRLTWALPWMMTEIMGVWIDLTASDGHRFAAWLAAPAGTPRGGIVVVQEIFGVNRHVRAVTDRFADDGYAALAPAYFDRVERGIDVGYDESGLAKGRAVRQRLGYEDAVRDTAAALAHLERFGGARAAGSDRTRPLLAARTGRRPCVRTDCPLPDPPRRWAGRE
jgi:hypothetical protein